jgi:hypothetical protein
MSLYIYQWEIQYLQKKAPVPIPVRGKQKTPGTGLPALGVGNSVLNGLYAVDRRRDWLPGGGRCRDMGSYFDLHRYVLFEY